MLIPNSDRAVISTEKLVEYLLAPTHPIGRFKASFFERMGFSQRNWHTLETELRKLLSADVDSAESTKFGTKYVISGKILGPNGRMEEIISVWIILTGERAPRFVTAYPGDEQ